MFEQFTDQARKVKALANQEAQRLDHEYIGTEHILLGLVKEGSGVAFQVLKELGVDLHQVRLEVEEVVPCGPAIVTFGTRPLSLAAKNVINYAIEEVHNFNHDHVGTQHLLLGLFRDPECLAARVLAKLGVNREKVRDVVLNLRGDEPPAEENASDST